jgi:ATP-dependent helicase/nuclease subunit A
MNAPRLIPNDIRDRQTRASDPQVSSFVAANAGSGKTYVLVNRVIRLLLEGVEPEKILCITFTKAAAANMAQRVFAKLGSWIAYDDAALDAAIREAGGTATRKTRERARKLFACALETPGGLKVQTIHALCTRLLQQFPFEANVAAHFTVLDDRDRDEMMQRANLSVLLDAAAHPNSPAGRALATAMTSAADVTFQDVVREACLSREHFIGWIDRAGGPRAALDELTSALGLPPDVSLEEAEREIVDGPYLARSEWLAAADIFEAGSKQDVAQAHRLRAASASGDAGIDFYLKVFLTDKGELRNSIITKSLAKDYPDFAARIVQEASRLEPLLEKRKAVRIRERSEALLTIGHAVAAHYRREKQERGQLDYDDLIDKTLDMLDRTHATWVHYKLDRGIDHVLIDEAQDTSPRQWDIISRIIADFASGKGARDETVRTVFAVGDEKQSIFSFQGAAPKEFNARRNDLQRRFTSAGLAWDKDIRLNFSFRSGSAILQAVDQVFAEEDIYRSIHAVENSRPVHVALRDAAPGLIDLWDIDEADPRQDIEGWQAPFDAVPETSAQVKLSRRIAVHVRDLIAGREDSGRPLRAGDILILVRRRGLLFNTIIQSLKHARIPVAGADRLKLTEHIAIIDLMSLADALLAPRDDLALAVALKSPLFGVSEIELFDLAADRGTKTLREALSDKAAANERYGEVEARLRACAERAASEMPFAFFAWLLGGDGGRARILARLGTEANDALDEFLELALHHEQRETASLQGFIAWLRAAETEVKRDMDIARNEVRVMTVHGAKGLEAPVVILADTTSLASDTHNPSLIRLPRGNGAISQQCVVWAGKKADDPLPVADGRAAMLRDAEDEYRRLLYVAMTRAAERLIVGGCKPLNRKNLAEGCWYELIRRGLESSGLAVEPRDIGGHAVRRFYREGELPARKAELPVPVAESSPLPEWLKAKVVSPQIVTSLQPSHAASGVTRHQVDAAARDLAIRKGLVVHRLMQSLPDVPEQQRRAAAMRFLARNASDWAEQERNVLIDRLLTMIGDMRFAALFADGSRAEVPLVGRLSRTGYGSVTVSGQVDRLAMSDTAIIIADYKTDVRPPASVATIPAEYRRQLALYRALLAKAYPGRVIRAVLFWTETAEIMEIPPVDLDAEIAGFIA